MRLARRRLHAATATEQSQMTGEGSAFASAGSHSPR